MKLFFALFLAFIPYVAVAQVNTNPRDALCGKAQPSAGAFAKLYKLESDDRKVSQELWMDEIDETIKGLWITPAESVSFVGRFISKEDFFFCTYHFTENQNPRRLFWGRLTKNGIELKDDKGQLQELKYFQLLNGSHAYHIEQVDNQSRYYVTGKTSEDEPETCLLFDSFPKLFQAKEKKLIPINGEIQKIRKRYLPKDLASHCEKNQAFPESTTVSLAPMHLGQRYISIKVDVVTKDTRAFQWVGEDFHYDSEAKKKIEGKSLLKRDARNALIAEVQYRIEKMFRQKGRFVSLDGSSLSFNDNSLVVSFAPVDEKGFYLEAYRVDIPIPWSIARKFVVDSVLKD